MTAVVEEIETLDGVETGRYLVETADSVWTVDLDERTATRRNRANPGDRAYLHTPVTLTEFFLAVGVRGLLCLAIPSRFVHGGIVRKNFVTTEVLSITRAEVEPE